MSDELAETGDDAPDEFEDVWDESEAAEETERARFLAPQPTGVPAVDAAVERLAELDDLPTGEHVAIYDAVHRQLQDALAHLDGA